MARNKCFVISPIGPEGSNTRERSDKVYRHIIARALENFEIIRASDIKKPGQITMQVIENIVECPILIISVPQ